MTAFSGHVNQAQPGDTVGLATNFVLPASVSLVGSSVIWELKDASGVVQASGAATHTNTTNLVGETDVAASATVTIPTTLATTVSGTNYQVRWTLVTSTITTYSFDTLLVMPATYAVTGSPNMVEMFGDLVTLSIVLPQHYDNVQYQMYAGNTALFTSVTVPYVSATSDGFLYQVAFDSSTLTALGYGASMIPLNVMWKYWMTASPNNTMRDTSNLYLITPSILAAAKDVEQMIARAYYSTGTPDVTFSVPDLLWALRQGMDRFNGEHSPTSFTMTNAQGTIRQFWIMYAQVTALRAQYLAEGMKAFDFSGQAVTLSVDRTQYFEQAASNIETTLNDRADQLKRLLAKRGLTGGDGSANPNALAYGAIGSVGVGVHPASNYPTVGVQFGNWGRF